MWNKAAFLFLEQIDEQFKDKFLPDPSSTKLPASFTAVPLSLNPRFKSTLLAAITDFNKNMEQESKRNDMLDRVKGHVQDVKDIVVENIEKILQRGEKIELLVDKTDRMQQTAFKFESSARHLKNAIWWKSVQKYVMLSAIFLLVVFFISSTACGGLNFKDCR